MSNILHSSIGDVCERLHQGLNTAGEKIKFYDSGYPIIQTRNIESGVVELDNKIKLMCEEDWLFYKNKYKPEIGDVFFTNIGTIGKTAVITEERDYLIHWNIFKLKPNPEKITSAYLRYVLENLTITGYFNKLQKGGTVDFVTKKMISEAQIFLPLLNEQQRIVAILDQAFEGIAKARANAQQNLQNARALFESHLQSVFTRHDEGWVKKKLGETSILKIIDGDRGVNYPNKEEFSDDGFCLFLNTKNVRPDGFNFDTTMFISEEKDKALRNGKLERQDVILTTRGTIGNVAVFDENVEFENIRINSGMLIFRPNNEKLLSSFLFEVFRSGIMKDQMTRHVSGAAQPQLPIKTLTNFEIPVPDTLESQSEIVASVRVIDAETKRLEALYQRKIALLDELKKSLLQQAFAGEL
jgi:type I restriction enzyme, S subunit